MRMQIIPIKTRRIRENDSLIEILVSACKSQSITLQNGDIIAIVSKVVALTEGKLRRTTKKEYMEEEADLMLDKKTQLTLKDGMLIPSAGIDTSNVAEGCSIGWPDDSYHSAALFRKQLQHYFRKNFPQKHLPKNLGILIFDSWVTPLRNGVTGLALGYAGFRGVEDCRGTKDLFGKKLRITQKNLADGLASSATLVCGEGNESIPFVVIRDAPVHFTTRSVSPSEIFRAPKDCLFQVLYPGSMKNLTKR